MKRSFCELLCKADKSELTVHMRKWHNFQRLIEHWLNILSCVAVFEKLSFTKRHKKPKTSVLFSFFKHCQIQSAWRKRGLRLIPITYFHDITSEAVGLQSIPTATSDVRHVLLTVLHVCTVQCFIIHFMNITINCVTSSL